MPPPARANPTPAAPAAPAAPADTAAAPAGATEAAGNAPRDEDGRTPPNPHWGFGQYWSKKKGRWVQYHFDEAAANARLEESYARLKASSIRFLKKHKNKIWQRFTETEPELEPQQEQCSMEDAAAWSDSVV